MKLPFKFVHHESVNQYTVKDASDEILIQYSFGRSISPSVEEAKKIVHMVNCHAELLESVKLALEFLKSLNPGWLAKTTGDVGLLNEFYIKSEKAIQKAEGIL